jgi:hypothetical protein
MKGSGGWRRERSRRRESQSGRANEELLVGEGMSIEETGRKMMTIWGATKGRGTKEASFCWRVDNEVVEWILESKSGGEGEC